MSRPVTKNGKSPVAKSIAKSKPAPAAKVAPARVAVAKTATKPAPAPIEKPHAKPAGGRVEALVAKKPDGKPTLKPTNGKAAPSATTNGAAVSAVVEAPKPSGKPMLTQGPVASKSLTKKGTFVLSKTPVLPPKPIKRKIERLEPQFIVVQPPVVQIATSEKAVKNKAGLSQKDLDFFRDLLLAKRRELVGDMSSMEREALRENNANLSNLPVHMADQGTDAYEQEFTLGLVEKDRGLLRELNDALAKIQNGTYGICEGTGEPISKPRLEAQPWARHSIEYARVLEKRKMAFRR